MLPIPDFSEIKRKIHLLQYRKEAQETVQETEELIRGMNEPIAFALKRVNEQIKNPLIAEAVKSLLSGKPRYQAYKSIFPEEVIRLLRVAEENEMPVADIIVEYAKQKEKIDTSQKKIKNKILSAIVIYLIICLIGYVIILQMSGIEMAKKQVSFFIRFYPLLLIPPAFFYAFFSYKPLAVKFNPIIRKIYNYFDAVNLLTIFRIADRIGITTNKVLAIYAELSPELKKRVRRLPQAERNAIGIGKVLAKYLTFTESTLLTQAIQTGRTEKIEDFMKKVSKKKLEKLDDVTEKTVAAIQTASSFFQALPLLYVAAAYIALMQAALKFINFNGVK